MKTERQCLWQEHHNQMAGYGRGGGGILSRPLAAHGLVWQECVCTE